MISWLEDNPLGITLASTGAGLLVISLLLSVIWALPASAPSAGSADDNNVPDLALPELAGNKTLDQYAVITEHPVFSSTRLPSIESDGDDDLDENLPEEEVEAPDVQLTGIIITPSIRMATFRRKDKGGQQPLSLVAFEGRPLEGNFGSWQVSAIDLREITLTSGAGEELQLKLEVHGVAMAPPAKPATGTQNKAGKKGQAQAGDDQPLSRAEEIRQRIAERREELRRAAEENEQTEPVSYQRAIQAMMGRNRPDKSKNESDN